MSLILRKLTLMAVCGAGLLLATTQSSEACWFCHYPAAQCYYRPTTCCYPRAAYYAPSCCPTSSRPTTTYYAPSNCYPTSCRPSSCGTTTYYAPSNCCPTSSCNSCGTYGSCGTCGSCDGVSAAPAPAAAYYVTPRRVPVVQMAPQRPVARQVNSGFFGAHRTAPVRATVPVRVISTEPAPARQAEKKSGWEPISR